MIKTMKLHTFFFLLLFSFSLSAQDAPLYVSGIDASMSSSEKDKPAAFRVPEYQPYNWWRGALMGGIGLVSGAAYGTHETAVHKPWNFPSSWNPQYWDASLSWRNKYKNGDPALGAKFPGSNTWLVATTDAKHLTSTIHKVGLFSGGMMVGITIGRKKPWEHYLADALLFAAGYAIGFQSTYVYNAWNW